MTEQEQQEEQDRFERVRASAAVARRRGRYYEPVPLVDLEALLAAASEPEPV